MNDKLDALDRLAKLKAEGTITEAEFLEEKRKLLLAEPAVTAIPKAKNGVARYVIGGIAALAGIVVVLALLAPAENKSGGSAPSNSASPTETATAVNAPLACDSPGMVGEVKGAIENSAASKLVNDQLLDLGHIHELYFDKKNNVRFCGADAALNSGETKLSFRLFFGPSGNPLVEVQEGEDAYNVKDLKASKVEDDTNRLAAAPASASPDASSSASGSGIEQTTSDIERAIPATTPDGGPISGEEKQTIALALQRARTVCHLKDGPANPNASADLLATMYQNEHFDYVTVNSRVPSLLSEDDKRCWQEARNKMEAK